MNEHPDVLERNPEAIRSARQMAAWIDRSAYGCVTLTGADRLDLLHRLTTNDLTGMAPGDGRQTVLLTEKARIIDVVCVLEHADHCMVITAPEKTTEVISWLKKYIIMDDVRVRNASSEQGMIEVMGPRSAGVVEMLTGLSVTALAKTNWLRTDEEDPLTVVRMPSSCEVSFWLIGSAGRIEAVRTILADAAADLPHLTDDEDAYLRITSGMGRIGHEWSEAYNPLEAGLLHLTSFTKGCYIGQEVVARLDSYNKVKQRVMALVGPATIAEGDRVVADNVDVGIVTSCTRSLGGTGTIALAYIRGEHANENTTITVRSNQGDVEMTIHLPPIEE